MAYYCCGADFGYHEETCKNYKPCQKCVELRKKLDEDYAVISDGELLVDDLREELQDKDKRIAEYQAEVKRLNNVCPLSQDGTCKDLRKLERENNTLKASMEEVVAEKLKQERIEDLDEILRLKQQLAELEEEIAKYTSEAGKGFANQAKHWCKEYRTLKANMDSVVAKLKEQIRLNNEKIEATKYKQFTIGLSGEVRGIEYAVKLMKKKEVIDLINKAKEGI